LTSSSWMVVTQRRKNTRVNHSRKITAGRNVYSIPTILGIPLMAKPIRPYPGVRPTNQPAVFLMAEPIEGYAPCRWQLGPRCDPGMIGFGRRDGKPFTVQQWTDLHSFIDTLMDLYSMLVDSQIIISEKINLENYKNYLRSIQSPLAGQLQQPVYMCSRCDRVALNKCSRCRFTLYCSKECQVGLFELYLRSLLF